MRSGGADYRDEDRLALADDLPKLEMALKPIVDSLPQSPGVPEKLDEGAAAALPGVGHVVPPGVPGIAL